MFLDDSACNLASLNLRKFQLDSGEFDVESYRSAISTTITAMEILVDNASYPTERIRENALKSLILAVAEGLGTQIGTLEATRRGGSSVTFQDTRSYGTVQVSTGGIA